MLVISYVACAAQVCVHVQIEGFFFFLKLYFADGLADIHYSAGAYDILKTLGADVGFVSVDATVRCATRVIVFVADNTCRGHDWKRVFSS